MAAAYPWARRASLTLFALVVLGAVISEHDTVRERLAELAGAVIALNLAAMGLSFLAARATRLHDRQATAISLELGVHNSALAIAIGASLSDEVAIPAAVYSTFMLFTGGTFAWVMARRNVASAARTAAATSAGNLGGP